MARVLQFLLRDHRNLLLLVSICCFLFAINGVSGIRSMAMRIGGWSPIEDLNDPHVVEIGRFAVDEYNKRSMQQGGGGGGLLEMKRVVKGESQVVSGINYHLFLEAAQVIKGRSAATTAMQYEAIVWEKAWLNYRNLTLFKQVAG